MKEREWETKQPSESRWPGTRGLGCHVRPSLTCSTGAIRPLPQGPAVRPDPVTRSPCFAFSQGFCCKDASRTRTAGWAPPLNLPWVFHLERTLLYMYNFCFKVFFLNKTYICCLFTYLRDCVVGFSVWREFAVSKGAGWSQSVVWKSQTIKAWWATLRELLSDS